MRLSTNIIYQQRTNEMNNAQMRWMTSGSMLASGKRVNKPSDDPLAASQAVRVNQSENRNQQHMTARGFAKDNMTLQMSVSGRMTDVLTDIHTTIVQASNQGGLSDQDRDSLAQQLNGLKEQLVGLGNTTDGNGRYIFGGYKSDAKPFVIDPVTGDVSYQGGNKPITQEVASDREMVSYFTGAQVLLSATSRPIKEPDGSVQSNIFQSINFAIEGLKITQTGAPQADLDKAQELMDKANRGSRNTIDNVSSYEAKLGLQLQEIDKLDFLGDDKSIQNQGRMSDLLDTDWTKTVSDYYREDAMFKASQQVFKEMNSMNLFMTN